MALAVRSTTQAGRIVALGVRPFIIFFGLTGLAYRLLSTPDRPGPTSESDAGAPTGYWNWLAELFPVDEGLRTALSETAQVAAGGLLAAAVLGLGLGALMRNARFGAPAAALNFGLLAAAGPVAALSWFYWLDVRLGLEAMPTSLLDDPVDALRYLLPPALAVGAMVAPGLGALLAAAGPYHEPPGLIAAASTLSSRGESREGWRFGLPAGSLLAGLLSAEALWGLGLTSYFLDALGRSDAVSSLNAMALIALGGAGVALVVDVVGLRAAQPVTASKAGLRLADGSRRPRPSVTVWIGGALLVVWLLTAFSGLLGSLESPDPTAGHVGALSDGHLLGTDRLGRDLLGTARHGLGSTLVVSIVPAVVALALASGLVVVQRRAGAIGEVVPGAVVDGLWWPLPILAAVAASTAADGENALGSRTLLLMALALVPAASRMLRREQVGYGIGGLTRTVGIGLFLAAQSMLAYFIIDYRTELFIASDTDGLGAQLSSTAPDLDQHLLPPVIIGLTMMLALGALYTLGGGLVRFGWQLSAARALAELDADDDNTFIVAPTGFSVAAAPYRPRLTEGPTNAPISDEHAPTLTDTPVVDLDRGAPEDQGLSADQGLSEAQAASRYRPPEHREREG